MFACPVCKAPLTAEDARLETCTVCGSPLPRETLQGPAAPAAAPAVTIGVTIDSTPPASATVPAPDQGTVTRTTGFEPADGTERGVDDAITFIWGSALESRPSPAATLRADASMIQREVHVTVNPRTLQRPDEMVGRQADYELLSPLGEGGMGIVFAARQTSIDRTVAIKMLKAPVTQSDIHRGRFLSEAIVTGDLEHPNIVPIYDLGADAAGVPFYVMKCIQGTPWNKVLRQKTFLENIEILMKVADAVAFAHSRGVLHRDLKPENIMLGGFGEVLLMDWGLALPVESSRAGLAPAGTPAYMAPEMAGGPFEQIGFASDVYLLGAILYEILTGNPPHTGRTAGECLMAAARNEIRPTEKTGELIDVARRAMATSPGDRYESVAALQTAIREYLSHSESIALADRAAQTLAEARSTDRYQTYAQSLFAFQEAVALWAGNSKAAQGAIDASLDYAASAYRKGDYDLAASLLEASDPRHAELLKLVDTARSEREQRQRRLVAAKRIGAALAVSLFLVITAAFFWIRTERDRAIAAEGVAQDQRRQADERRREAVDAREAERQQRQRAEGLQVEAEQQRDQAVQARDAARRAQSKEEYTAYLARIGLAAAKVDEDAFTTALAVLGDCPPGLRHWEWRRLVYLSTQAAQSYPADNEIEAVAATPDGRLLAAAGWGPNVLVINREHPNQRRTLSTAGEYVFALAFSPDGRYLAAGTNHPGGYLTIWDLERSAADGRQPVQLAIDRAEGHTDAVLSASYTADGRWLLTTSYDRTARLWDVREPGRVRLARQLGPHGDWVRSAAMGPIADGRATIITASQDGYARVWSVAVEEKDSTAEGPPLRFRGHSGPVEAVAVSPDGLLVASAGYDRRILLWKTADVRPFDMSVLGGKGENVPPVFEALEGHSAAVTALKFSADGTRLLSAGQDNTVRIWDVAARRLLVTLRGHGGPVRSCAFLGPDSRYALSGGLDKQMKLWDVDKYREYRVIGGRVVDGHRHQILAADLSSDGRLIITASRDRTARLWDVATGQAAGRLEEGHAIPPSSALFFADGKKLATASLGGNVRIWDVATGAQTLSISAPGARAAMAVSRDGRSVLTGGGEGTVMAALWDAQSGQPIRQFVGQTANVTAVAFSPDDQMVFCGDSVGRCWLFRAADGQLLWKARRHSREISSAAFLPDGRTILTASLDNSVGRWDAATGEELSSLLLKHPDAVTSLAVSPDGRHALTACADRVARWWNLADARIEWQLPAARQPIIAVSLLGATARAIVATADGKARLWDLAGRRELPLAGPGGASASSHTLLWTAAASPSGEHFLVVDGEGAFLYRTDSGEEVMRFSDPRTVASARFSPDGRRAVAASWDGSARIWALETKTVIRKLHGGHAGFVNDAIYSPDGNTIFTAGDDGLVRAWNAADGQLLPRVFRGHSGAVKRFDLSPDGRRLLTASTDGTARIWDTETGAEIHCLAAHQGAVLAAAFSPDGRFAITGSEDTTARLWDAATGEPLRPEALPDAQRAGWFLSGEEPQPPIVLKGHTASVAAVAFSLDGRRAITGSDDGTARVWDLVTGKETLTLRGHREGVTYVAFSRDGSKILSAGRDGTVIEYDSVDPLGAENGPTLVTAAP